MELLLSNKQVAEKEKGTKPKSCRNLNENKPPKIM